MQLRCHNFLTLDGISAEALNYRLGNRLALVGGISLSGEDRRSGIANDPNRKDDSLCILRSIGKVIGVRLETVEMAEGLPGMGADKASAG